MRIAFVGNCQLESLTWYFKHLLPNAECWYINFNSNTYNGTSFNSQVKCPYDGIEYLSSCDYVVYLRMYKYASPLFYFPKITTLIKPHCKILSIPNFHLDVQSPDPIKGMLYREKRKGIDLSINVLLKSKSIEKFYPLKQKQPNHPPVEYFLELIRHICIKFNLPFFSNEDCNMFLKKGFPFGSSMK